jgi:hypothetical protein
MTDFVTITSNNKWFNDHPEKVAGTEYETTSIFFPIQVKGTMEDVLRVTGLSKETTDHNKLALAKAKAKALKMKLKLRQ